MLKNFRSWHSGLSSFGKKLFGVGGALVLVGTVAAATHNNDPKYITETASHGASGQVQSDTIKKPTITTENGTETVTIPFTTSTINDPGLDSGKTVVRTQGVNGVRTITYKTTYTDGTQTDKQKLSEAVTTPVINQVNAVGTKVAAAPAAPKQNVNCDPNYDANRGACVPIASDVDCAGGSGNGPAYVNGPVYVTGTDIYALDGDGNGVGCQ